VVRSGASDSSCPDSGGPLILESPGLPLFFPRLFSDRHFFGIFPGFFEEIGWMGYAFPRMQSKHSVLAASIFLGVLWGLWHLPVVDSLGAAAPHGAYWLPFFLAFVALVTAMRVLIVSVYSNTRSVPLAQLMHASSTACLVVLSPSRISPAQETLWYAIYAAILWAAVVIVATTYGKGLVRQPMRGMAGVKAFRAARRYVRQDFASPAPCSTPAIRRSAPSICERWALKATFWVETTAL
jgi:CAAX prenyl protease-like protein